MPRLLLAWLLPFFLCCGSGGGTWRGLWSFSSLVARAAPLPVPVLLASVVSPGCSQCCRRCSLSVNCADCHCQASAIEANVRPRFPPFMKHSQGGPKLAVRFGTCRSWNPEHACNPPVLSPPGAEGDACEGSADGPQGDHSRHGCQDCGSGAGERDRRHVHVGGAAPLCTQPCCWFPWGLCVVCDDCVRGCGSCVMCEWACVVPHAPLHLVACIIGTGLTAQCCASAMHRLLRFLHMVRCISSAPCVPPALMYCCCCYCLYRAQVRDQAGGRRGGAEGCRHVRHG